MFRVAHREGRAECLRHEEVISLSARDLHAPVKAHAQEVAERVALRGGTILEYPTDRGQSLCRAERVPVAHRPQRAAPVPERGAEIAQTVNLSVSRLACVAINRCAVIPVDGGRPRSERTRGTLGAVIHVAGHTSSGVTSGPTISSRLNCDATWNRASSWLIHDADGPRHRRRSTREASRGVGEPCLRRGDATLPMTVSPVLLWHTYDR